jgi:hypothetical protein
LRPQHCDVSNRRIVGLTLRRRLSASYDPAHTRRQKRVINGRFGNYCGMAADFGIGRCGDGVIEHARPTVNAPRSPHSLYAAASFHPAQKTRPQKVKEKISNPTLKARLSSAGSFRIEASYGSICLVLCCIPLTEVPNSNSPECITHIEDNRAKSNISSTRHGSQITLRHRAALCAASTARAVHI